MESCIQLEICIQLGVGDVQPLAEHSRLQLFEVCGGILACCTLGCVAAFSLGGLRGVCEQRTRAGSWGLAHLFTMLANEAKC